MNSIFFESFDLTLFCEFAESVRSDINFEWISRTRVVPEKVTGKKTDFIELKCFFLEWKLVTLLLRPKKNGLRTQIIQSLIYPQSSRRSRSLNIRRLSMYVCTVFRRPLKIVDVSVQFCFNLTVRRRLSEKCTTSCINWLNCEAKKKNKSLTNGILCCCCDSNISLPPVNHTIIITNHSAYHYYKIHMICVSDDETTQYSHTMKLMNPQVPGHIHMCSLSDHKFMRSIAAVCIASLIQWQATYSRAVCYRFALVT